MILQGLLGLFRPHLGKPGRKMWEKIHRSRAGTGRKDTDCRRTVGISVFSIGIANSVMGLVFLKNEKLVAIIGCVALSAVFVYIAVLIRFFRKNEVMKDAVTPGEPLKAQKAVPSVIVSTLPLPGEVGSKEEA